MPKREYQIVIFFSSHSARKIVLDLSQILYFFPIAAHYYLRRKIIMKLQKHLGTLFTIITLLCCILLFCARTGKDAEGKEVPAEFFATWSLYRDCPTNILTIKRDGTFEYVDCYHNEKGEEKRDTFYGKFHYLGDNKIKIDKPGDVLNVYEISNIDGKSVLKSSGFIFYSSF